MKKIAQNAALVKTSSQLARLRRANRIKGASSVEYIIVLIFIAVAGIVLFKNFGSEFKKAVSTASTSFQQVQP